MTQLNREWLKKQRDELKKVEIKELGIEVYLRKLSVNHLKKLSAESNKKDEMDQMVDSILYCCVDEKGNQLFTENSDRELILDQGIDLINHLFSEIMNFCSLGDNAIKDKAKN